MDHIDKVQKLKNEWFLLFNGAFLDTGAFDAPYVGGYIFTDF